MSSLFKSDNLSCKKKIKQRPVIFYHLGEGRGNSANFGLVTIKFTDPPLRSLLLIPPHWQSIFLSSRVYTLLATTDPHSVPPENYVIPSEPSPPHPHPRDKQMTGHMDCLQLGIKLRSFLVSLLILNNAFKTRAQ